MDVAWSWMLLRKGWDVTERGQQWTGESWMMVTHDLCDVPDRTTDQCPDAAGILLITSVIEVSQVVAEIALVDTGNATAVLPVTIYWKFSLQLGVDRTDGCNGRLGMFGPGYQLEDVHLAVVLLYNDVPQQQDFPGNFFGRSVFQVIFPHV